MSVVVERLLCVVSLLSAVGCSCWLAWCCCVRCIRKECFVLLADNWLFVSCLTAYFHSPTLPLSDSSQRRSQATAANGQQATHTFACQLSAQTADTPVSSFSSFSFLILSSALADFDSSRLVRLCVFS